MTPILKALFIILALFCSFSPANASNLSLRLGESATVAGTNISCEDDAAECGYIAGNVYCGYSCQYVSGNVYCANQPTGKCEYIAGNVYCGVGCKYISGNVYCAKGGLAKPAIPAKP